MNMQPTAEGDWWVRYGESTFIFRDDRHGLVMRIKNVRTDDGHVLGDLFASLVDDGAQRTLLTRPRVNLTSDRSIPGLMRSLEIAGKAWGDLQSYDWRMLLERMCAVLVAQMDRKGTVTKLRAREDTELAQPMAFKGFVPAGLLSALVAHGGTGKSLTAGMLAVAITTGRQVGPFEPLIQGPVLYLDWENDHELHERRITRLCRGLGLGFPEGIIHYRAHGSKLSHAEADIVELAYQERVVATILDSIGFAAGGNLNESDVATGSINALKHVPGTKIMIAHVSKAAAMGLQTTTPSGNAFFWNGCQAVYDLRASDPALDGSLVLALHHNKANAGPRMVRPLGVHVAFDDPAGPITVEPVEIRGDSIGGEGLPLHMRVTDVLARGAATVGDIADALGLYDRQGMDSVTRCLKDLRHRDRVVTLPGKPERWGLAAPGESSRPRVAEEGPDYCAICGGKPYKYDGEGQGWCRLHWTA